MAPTIAPNTDVTRTIDKVMQTLADLTSFQAWVGHPGDAVEAKESTYFMGFEDFLGNQEFLQRLPLAIVEPPEDEALHSAAHYATGNPYEFQPAWRFNLVFIRERPAQLRFEDRIFDWWNVVTEIMAEFFLKAGDNTSDAFGTTDYAAMGSMFQDESRDQALPIQTFAYMIQRVTDEGA